MTDIRVRGTDDPAEIAVVVALLRRDHGPAPRPTGLAAWQRTRRAALAVDAAGAGRATRR